MLQAELAAEFPFGVLLITDGSSAEPIPSWATSDEQVAVADTALVLRVLHGNEGEVSVRVCDAESEAMGVLVFTGQIDLPSGILRISDALGGVTQELNVGTGQHVVRIFADSGVEASAVDLVLTLI